MTTEELDQAAQDYADRACPYKGIHPEWFDGLKRGYIAGFRKAEYRESLRRELKNKKAEPVPYKPDQFAFAHPADDSRPTHNED